jgi:membrane protease YdiL (CAAX protease family)
MVVMMWVIWPALMAGGMDRAASYTLVMAAVGSLLSLAALIGYVLEGNPLTWKAFAARFWLDKFSRRILLWVGGGLIVSAAVGAATNAASAAVFNAMGYTPPDLAGHVTRIGWVLIMLAANIVGEELWWRGYIFPRQEVRFGRWTWLVQGTLWAFFHTFKWWSLPALLIFCQVYPFITQRTRSIWPAVLIHTILNGIGPVALVIGQLAQ